MSPYNDSDSSSSGHLDGLREELENIYLTYSGSQTNQSLISLESIEDERSVNEDNEQNGASSRGSRIPVVHISSRFSSLEGIRENTTNSAPLTNTYNSSQSFNFNTEVTQLETNSSLNVLVDTSLSSQTNHNSPEGVDEDDNNDVSSSASSSETPAANGYENTPNAKSLWRDSGSAVRKIKDSEGPGYRIIKRGVQDFEFGRNLGEGSYSTVVLATDKHNSKSYAIKILDKRHIIKEKKVKYVNIEKHALNRLSNGMGIVSLYFTFQDKDSLYFVLDFASNGELLNLIKKYGTLNEESVRHFSAQILDAVRFMHDNGVIHRDIKPENILLDSKMRIQITDFGTAKLLDKGNNEDEDYPLDVRANSFVGTAEYVSPELLESKYCGKPGDIWAFGCIVYQMIAGKPPFKAPNEYLTFQKITKLQYAFSAGFPTIIRDLIKRILVLSPSRRLKIPQIQAHLFYSGIDWTNNDAIWNSNPPEIGPYKITAQSMKSMPELTKGYSSTRPTATAKPRLKKKETEISVNPASAAAFVLNKGSDSDVTQNDLLVEDAAIESNSKPTVKAPEIGSRRATNKQIYIPGTNILRPTINNRQPYSSTSTASSKKSSRKLKHDVMEILPMTSAELAWSDYFIHPEERILKVGPVIFTKQTTELFEKKHKGLLHDSPLSLANRMQGPKGGKSFLTHIIQHSDIDWRSATMQAENEIHMSDESAAITTYKDLNYSSDNESPKKVSNDSPNDKKGRSIFKKLLASQFDKSSDSSKSNNGADNPQRDSAPHTCVLMITTHGRALIFYKKQGGSDFQLVEKISLNYPFIQIKEVVSPPKGSSLPSIGVFAIVSSKTSFAFEVERSDVTSWTEALARAKINQSERERKEKDLKSAKKSPQMERQLTNDSNVTPISKSDSHISMSSVRPKRKTPPRPINLSNIDSTGLSSDRGNNAVSGMLQAAQLAVSGSSNRTSMATKSRPAASNDHKSKPYQGQSAQSSAHPAQVTALNSKFLARSQRKK